MKALIALAAVVFAVAACASPAPSSSPAPPTDYPVASPVGTPFPVTPQPTSTPPAETDVCVPEPGPSPYSIADPCPPAIDAVRIAIARLGLPIARIVLQPQPFDCGTLWPGVDTPQICFGPFVMSGTTMHGWVSFTGSAKVAAVSLHLQPATGPSPAPSPMWIAFVAAFQVPPAGWVMP